jgi:hypothetical protein
MLLKNAPLKSMKNLKLALIIALTAGVWVVARAGDPTNAAPTAATLPSASAKTGVTFDTDIKPIFQASCVDCHNGAGQRPPKAGLALDTRTSVLTGSRNGAVVTVGDSIHSDLVLSVAHIGDDPDQFMPKGRNAKKLTSNEIGLIRAWIDQGAK